ncbi:MAG: DNA oxidative demethylase AlkB [Gammaproteobacteria bacterium]|nr:DNA oxidative demethylase AlkB [Gammaproteobacteria bacterium]
MDLFENEVDGGVHEQAIGAGAVVLRGFAAADAARLVAAVEAVIARAPLRHMLTPGGQRMSVAMSNCGALGWISDRRGYRYDAVDPLSGRHWPALPALCTSLAARAARQAGYAGFAPDACLVNRYEPGTRLSLHQDRNERDFDAPIVSVSLGIAAVFLFGGTERADRPLRVPLRHGDVVVWGGPARLRYHGVLPLAAAQHPLTGGYRYNLTLRKAG